MRLTRYLNELFKTDVPVKITIKTNNDFKAVFTVGEIEYEFSAGKERLFRKIFKDHRDPDSGWYITFTAGEKGREDITGTGNAIQVFAAVIKTFKIFIKSYHPHIFAFHAKEKSRVKLYDRFAKMITGYTLTKIKDKGVFEGEWKYTFEKT